MITRDQAKDELFQSELHLVKAFNPGVDVAQFRQHWEKTISDSDIDRAWNIRLEMEAIE
jgi:hypothetical protein